MTLKLNYLNCSSRPIWVRIVGPQRQLTYFMVVTSKYSCWFASWARQIALLQNLTHTIIMAKALWGTVIKVINDHFKHLQMASIWRGNVWTHQAERGSQSEPRHKLFASGSSPFITRWWGGADTLPHPSHRNQDGSKWAWSMPIA